MSIDGIGGVDLVGTVRRQDARRVGRPLLLDLFCGAGGAAVGYHRAGFDILGVDIKRQPRYPFPMVQADALDFLTWARLEWVAAIHASPPCQFRTQMAATQRIKGFGSKVDLLTPALAIIPTLGKPWVIENVVGAKREMQATLMLHGGMFGLEVHRPRLFQSSELIMAPPAPLTKEPIGVYGYHPQRNIRTRNNGTMNGSKSIMRVARSVEEAQRVMGMPWADWNGCREAIPPAYTEWIGGQLITIL